MISELRDTPYKSRPAPYPTVNIFNVLWSDIISPTRKQFVSENEFESRSDEEMPCNKLYFPFGGDKVEYSSFWMQPSMLDFGAALTLIAQDDGNYKFTVFTCGGIKIYCNGQLVVSFMSYLRNQERKKQFALPLKKGENKIYIQVNDLAERDTQVYFKLRYDDAMPLTQHLPIQLDEEYLNTVREVLESMFMPQFNYGTKNIYVNLQKPYAEELKIKIALQFADGHIENPVKVKDLTLKPMQTEIFIGELVYKSIGMVSVNISAEIGNIVLSKKLVFEYYEDKLMDNLPQGTQDRKTAALQFLAKHGTDNFTKALAIIETNGDMQNAEKIIEQELARIDARYDCSDFRTPAFFYALRSQKVPLHIKEKLRQSLLNFRYWYDENGNDVMWFFSENHALCFNATEFLAGELFENELFTNSGITGAQHRRKAKRLLMEWFKVFMQYGFSEWNSSVYIPIDVIALLALYDMAQDSEIRLVAKQALDKTFEILACNSYKGVVAASYGRIYFKNLIGRRTSEASSLNYIASGEGWLNHHCFSPVLFALSSYMPSENILSLYKADNNGIINKSVQGVERVNLYSYKTPDFILASAVNYKSHQSGLQEHVLQAMILDCDTQIWINHPGERVIFGEGRPSYFAGNGTLPCVEQNTGSALVIYDLLEQEVDFTHAFCPLKQFEEYKLLDNWIFLRKKNVCVGIFAKNGLNLTQTGVLKNYEIISPGRKNQWRLEISSSYAKLDEFAKAMLGK